MDLADCYIGQRVELAPHMDLWMRGARYGSVVEILTGRELGFVRVRVDAIDRVKAFRADDLTDVYDTAHNRRAAALHRGDITPEELETWTDPTPSESEANDGR